MDTIATSALNSKVFSANTPALDQAKIGKIFGLMHEHFQDKCQNKSIKALEISFFNNSFTFIPNKKKIKCNYRQQQNKLR